MFSDNQTFFCGAQVEKKYTIAIVLSQSKEVASKIFKKKYNVIPQTIISKEELQFMVNCCSYAQEGGAQALPDIDAILSEDVWGS